MGVDAKTLTVDRNDALCDDVTGSPCYCSIAPALSAATNGDQVLVFPGTYYEALSITNALRLEGTDRDTVILDGGATGRVVNIALPSSDPAILTDLTIQHGDAGAGGGVYVSGNLDMQNCVVQENTAFQGGGLYFAFGEYCYISGCDFRKNDCDDVGGGVHNSASSAFIYLSDSVLESNSALIAGGAVFGGWASLSNCVLRANTGGLYGGAVEAERCVVHESDLHGNLAGNGGGFHVEYLSIYESAVYSNSAADSGGGIYATAYLRTRNATISGNVASNRGGGISATGNITLAASTIAFNCAPTGGGMYLQANAEMTSTILAKNMALTHPNASGARIDSDGYNLIGDTNGVMIIGTTIGNLLEADPRLLPLADNGGFAPTHALKYGSPAIDAGTCTAYYGVTITNDQRLFVRPVDGKNDGSAVCDIGAYELQAPIAPPFFINEVDCDTPSWDDEEFIELYDGGDGDTPLADLVLVFYDGYDSEIYQVFDLDGYSTDSNGYFVAGNPGVPDVDLTFRTNSLQNGMDAVALHYGTTNDFQVGDYVTTNGLIDALVYETWDTFYAGLMVLLSNGESQVNEDGKWLKDINSCQRCPNGSGGKRSTATYDLFPPTPGAANRCVDSDADGMDDAWENAHGLNFVDDDASDDGDDDGDDNLREYIADTDPGNSNDFFRVLGITGHVSRAVSFVSSTNRFYTLEQVGVFGGTWESLSGCTHVPGLDGETSLYDTNLSVQRVYRVKVQLP